MRIVNNNGKGNCMYYAYAISLMYWLRQQDTHVINDVFKQLKLQNTIALCSILSKHHGALNEFSDSELNIIQHQLGPACRALTGDQIQQEFLSNPLATSTFANCVYGIKKAFKQQISQQFPSVGELIELTVAEQHFQDAEIYKVIGLSKAIETFVENCLEHIVTSVKITSDIQISKNDMCTFLQEKTIEFLSAEHCKWLNAYVKHVKTDTKWGTEELLYALHRAIQGENISDISIMVLQNGQVKPWQNPEDAHIVLDNRTNIHWVSSIPSAFLVSEDKIKAIYEFKQLLESMNSQLTSTNDLKPHIERLNKMINHYSNKNVNEFIVELEKHLKLIASQNDNTNWSFKDFLLAGWREIKLAFKKLISIITLGAVKLDRSTETLSTNIIKARDKCRFFKNSSVSCKDVEPESKNQLVCE